MKQERSLTSRWLQGLLVLSGLIFSACGNAAREGEITAANKTATDQPIYTNAASASNVPPTPDMKGRSENEIAGEYSVGERYAAITENPFLEASRVPLSTFSIDVDTASYANVRRYLDHGQLPPKDAVRIEELINYFEYDYPQPVGDVPFSVTSETAACPWNTAHKIVQIGLQGKKIALDNTPPSNLVFLIDVSGSMNSPDKLPLLKDGLRMMVSQLKPYDRVAIAVYAGSSGLVLPSTTVSDKVAILGALDDLEAGGSTNGGEGIRLAYTVAANNFIEGGNNRVILATDGDFNVGETSDDALVSLIENKRKSGIFLSVLGFGTGNTNDSMMEKLADKGNGNYAYIDSRDEARKALGNQVAGTLYTIAKDVKIQVEFNPALVAGYRLIGYENRSLADRDFDDDKKDAGDIGAGHSVTALYEIVPAGQKIDNGGIELRYSKTETGRSKFGSEMMTVKLRYKDPDGAVSKLLTMGVLDDDRAIDNATDNLRLAAAVAQFGMLLRDSRYKGSSNFKNVIGLAASQNADLKGYRAGFLELVQKASSLKG